MFLSMAQDARVIVVKLADRLHNMRTLEHLKPEKQRRIARETLEIFAPLANRLGIGRFKWELEDLSFKYLEPEAYRQIQDCVSEKRGDRESRLQQVAATLRDQLEAAGGQCGGGQRSPQAPVRHPSQNGTSAKGLPRNF
jgi:guanosine-3',5'-bis(diphosphate) 3'-pyrophosphohydrolase